MVADIASPRIIENIKSQTEGKNFLKAFDILDIIEHDYTVRALLMVIGGGHW